MIAAAIATTSVLGTLPSWILVLFAILVAWRVSRGGGGSAVSELAKANEVLTARVHELGSEVRDLRIENAELRGKTDFAIALAPVLEWTGGHERRAQERHDAMLEATSSNTRAVLNVLELVAQRLGPEPNGDPA